MFLLFHWRLATQSARSWYDCPSKSRTAVLHDMITHDLEWPWHVIVKSAGRWRPKRWFRKFIEHFRPIRKEIVSWIHNNINSIMSMSLNQSKPKNMHWRFTFCKPRRRRQRGHGKKKNAAQHVRLYISEPSYTKQQREITTICVVCEPKPRRQIILISIWNSTLL